MCEDCRAKPDLGCDACGKTPSKSVRINSKPIWRGAQFARCLLCAMEKEVDVSEVCKSCNNENYEIRIRDVVLCGTCASNYEFLCRKCGEATDVYAEGTTYCPTCFYGDDFAPVGTEGRHWQSEACHTCGEISHLNEEGVCKNCYVESAVSAATNDDWGNTKVCPECRRITKRGNKLCTTCSLKKRSIKTCVGCTTKFQFVTRKQNFCPTCIKARSENKCTSCGNKVGNFDEHGWCTKCQSEHKP